MEYGPDKVLMLSLSSSCIFSDERLFLEYVSYMWMYVLWGGGSSSPYRDQAAVQLDTPRASITGLPLTCPCLVVFFLFHVRSLCSQISDDD